MGVKIIKPPLGVVPRNFADRDRFEDLKSAIMRYAEQGFAMPLDWVIEFNELAPAHGTQLV